MAAKTDAPRTINLRLIRAKHAAEELGTLPAGRFEREIRFINVSPQGAAKRLSAELLPWQEAYDSLEAHLYLPLKDFPVYQWFSVEEVCKCVETKFLDACKPTFKSTDATELSAQEWEMLAAIKRCLPLATFHLREHKADCMSFVPAVVRRGVIVKFAVDNLTFKREFAL